MEPLAELAKRLVSSLRGAERFEPNKWRAVRETDQRLLMLPSDAALILGESPALGVPAFYASREEVFPEGIYLLGNDLDQLGPHTSFARIVFVKLRNFFSYERPNAFEKIKDIRNLLGTLHMEGIMVNDAPFDKQETVLFSSEGFSRLSFESLGNNFINVLKSNSDVEKVAVAFVTLPSFPFGDCKRQAVQADETLEALASLWQMDAKSCPQCPKKAFCDANPWFKKLHDARTKQKEANLKN
jgi:hypothetical protein